MTSIRFGTVGTTIGSGVASRGGSEGKEVRVQKGGHRVGQRHSRRTSVGGTRAWAEMGFDPKYERDYNIFNPADRYQPDNPLNPANAYEPDNPFNPVNRYDPGNPANPINQFNPNNPFNPINQFRPDNPLNPIKRYDPNVPFAPLHGFAGPDRSRGSR